MLELNCTIRVELKANTFDVQIDWADEMDNMTAEERIFLLSTAASTMAQKVGKNIPAIVTEVANGLGWNKPHLQVVKNPPRPEWLNGLSNRTADILQENFKSKDDVKEAVNAGVSFGRLPNCGAKQIAEIEEWVKK